MDMHNRTEPQTAAMSGPARTDVHSEDMAVGQPAATVGWWVTGGLGVLVVTSLLVGLWAQFAPVSFWQGFPVFGRGWVATDGPYNEHLIRDVGGLQLGMAVVLLSALLRPMRVLVRLAALAAVAWQAPHVVYHLIHVADLPTRADQWAQSVLLIATLVVALTLLIGTFNPRLWRG